MDNKDRKKANKVKVKYYMFVNKYSNQRLLVPEDIVEFNPEPTLISKWTRNTKE